MIGEIARLLELAAIEHGRFKIIRPAREIRAPHRHRWFNHSSLIWRRVYSQVAHEDVIYEKDPNGDAVPLHSQQCMHTIRSVIGRADIEPLMRACV